MFHFNSLDHFLKVLARESKLLDAMFENRNLNQRPESLVGFVDDDYERLEMLTEMGVLNANSQHLKIEERLLEFLEDYLEVTEEIHTSYISDYLTSIKERISYYFKETQTLRKHRYFGRIKTDLRKIGRNVIANVNSLRKNVEEVYKTESNFSIKKEKLENYRKRRQDIEDLIKEVFILIDSESLFQNSADEELQTILWSLKTNLREATNNLLEVQQQIIDFLNQVKLETEIFEKLQRVKYLKDQFELKQKSNIESLLHQNKDLFFEPRYFFPTRLSLDFLDSDEAYDVITRTNQKYRIAPNLTLTPGGTIDLQLLEEQDEEETIMDLNRLKEDFVTQEKDLFSFLQDFRFEKDLNMINRVILYCKLASRYDKEFEITDNTESYENLEYALIYPFGSLPEMQHETADSQENRSQIPYQIF